MIGANCVVTRNVPPGSVVMTTPNRIIPRALSLVAQSADERAAVGASEPAPADR
jgi:serine acetyltransferase